MTGEFKHKCTNTVTGTNKEYRVGGTSKNSAYSVFSGPDTKVDFWNSPRFSEIKKLEICDTGC